MSKRAVFVTFVVSMVLVGAVGLLSWWMASNQPSADVAAPPIPTLPQTAPAERPYVPPRPMVCGDSNRDGIVNALDINVIIGNWKQVTPRFNLVDSAKDQKGMLNALDLSSVISHWRCLEGKAGCDCIDPNETGVICPAIAINCTPPSVAEQNGYDSKGCPIYQCSGTDTVRTPPPVPTMPPQVSKTPPPIPTVPPL